MTQLKHVSARKALALCILAAVAAVAAAAAFATPGSGFITRDVVARGTLEPHFKIKLQDSSSPGDVVVQHFVLAPGGYSGWHFHPGPAIVTIKSGEFTLDQAMDCSSATYAAGQVVVEPAEHVHQVRNIGASNLDFWVTFLDVPVGSPQRIEADDPGC
jgi:quercetin dioxygenase-like cupin family protein